MSIMTPRKLKILAIHGYTQNATVFAKRTAALKKHLQSMAEFVYVSAPHCIDERRDPKLLDQTDDTQRTWWFYNSESVPATYQQCDTSLVYLRTVLEEQGPFDGLYGFSQGATMASLLALTMCQDPNWTIHDPLKFCICVSGFVPKDMDLAQMYSPDHRCTTPSLHIWGTADQYVSPYLSHCLSDSFLHPSVYEHEGGHYLPSNEPGRTVVSKFLLPFALTLSSHPNTK